MPVMQGMAILTHTPQVLKAREGVMELLLLNHPLDCPICDQAGECDLQDQAIYYGTDMSRSTSPRRGVDDKDLSPIVAAIMTRCIQCTRCVRYSTEIQGKKELGTTSRGYNMEVGTYTMDSLDDSGNPYMDGNLVDLCPVGALTNKLQQFEARSWERMTTSVDIIDPADSIGSWVTAFPTGESTYGKPRHCDPINQQWLPDKSRYIFNDDSNHNFNDLSLGTTIPEGGYIGRDFGEASRGYDGFNSIYSTFGTYSNSISGSMIPFETMISSDLIIIHNVDPRYTPQIDSRLLSAWIAGTLEIINVSSDCPSSDYQFTSMDADSLELATLIRNSTFPILLSNSTLNLNIPTSTFDPHPGAYSEATEGRSRTYSGFDLEVSHGGNKETEFTTGFSITESDSHIVAPIAHPLPENSIQRSCFGIPGKVSMANSPEDHLSTITNGISLFHPSWTTNTNLPSLSESTTSLSSLGIDSYNYWTTGPWMVRTSPECRKMATTYDTTDIIYN
jgi:hypothetical protein